MAGAVANTCDQRVETQGVIGDLWENSIFTIRNMSIPSAQGVQTHVETWVRGWELHGLISPRRAPHSPALTPDVVKLVSQARAPMTT